MSETALSIAFYLRDGYSKSQAKGNIQVSLKSSGKTAMLNPSDCYTFVDLPEGKYVVKIESEFYIYDEIEYEAYTEGAVSGEVFDLIPAPNYPFFPQVRRWFGGCCINSKILKISKIPKIPKISKILFLMPIFIAVFSPAI